MSKAERGLVRWLILAALAATAADNPATKATPPDQAAAAVKVPEGFKVTLFAGEPDVRQPIALAFDAKGRLWVAECYSYPDWEKKGKTGRDRVLVFEDADGDGKFDRRTVFADKIANLSGLELGFGGVWVCASPNLLFIPDRDGDLTPDGPPEVVLDGWSLEARHNVFNGLVWGPDGWLWGCNGILATSRVGKPGTPDAKRTAMNCGVWRYHPTRKTFEVVANGTTNPWGLDFDDLGEAFITNCVIPHLFHVIPGAHFTRMYGEDFNPHLYGLIPSCADHVHWNTAERWLDIRAIGVSETTDKAGGGHAHSGAFVYLGDTWPDRYRNTVFMGNIHGRRLNNDTLERVGSGYVARHNPDFFQSSDPWFRTVAQKVGPDGAVYILDWSDTGECHEDDADGAHRENGRIFRVQYGDTRAGKMDVAALTDLQLVDLQRQKNDWHVRQARRVLQERAAAGRDMGEANKASLALFERETDPARKLRALWASNATGGLGPDRLTELLHDPSEDVRAWAIRLLVDDPERPLSKTAAERFEQMAKFNPSAKVRLALASALQRLPFSQRIPIAVNLMGREEDANDANLPLMLWYGIEPVVVDYNETASVWALMAESALLRRFIARRVIAASPEKGPGRLISSLGTLEGDPARAVDVLGGVADALRGRRSVPMPPEWNLVAARFGRSGRVELRDLVLKLGLVFGDPSALAALRARSADKTAPAASRRSALEALADARVPGLAADLIARLDDPELRGTAVRALSEFDDATVPAEILKRYPAFPESDRDDAVQTLATRPAWALALLDAVGRGVVPRRDVSAAVARQLQAFGRKDVDEALAKHWGAVRPSGGDKAALTARYKALLTPESVRAADPSRGRLVYQRTCQSCHKLYSEGGDVGPELTGSDRANVDYLLLNVLDPSASVPNEYRVTNVATADGRLVSGIVREQTPSAVVLRTVNGLVVVPRDEVEEVRATASSMMPDGLFEKLTDAEVRDLAAYLGTKSQVAPAEARP